MTKHMMTADEVFVTDGFPEHNYVALEQGRKEDELRDGLDVKNKIISISGPSKSGKTTLCDKVIGTEKGTERIYVTGDTIKNSDDLWRQAYSQALDFKVGSYPDGPPPFYDTSMTDVLDAITMTDLPLVIDDFHYIPRDVQRDVCRQLKNAAYAGIRVLCLSVPHRGDDPIRSNSDLSGRYFSVSLDFWSEDDLKQIATSGFPKVGFPVNESFNGLLAVEALKSPQIMQTLCLEACRMHGVDIPLENVSPSADDMSEIKKRALRSYQQPTALEFLRRGPSTRGKERLEYRLLNGSRADVYECLVAALRLEPPFQQIGLDELRQRLATLLTDTKEPNIRSALKQYNDLFKDQAPPIDWDDEKRTLTIVDPHFYFFLRNHGSD